MQQAICDRFGADFVASEPNAKLGISRCFRANQLPLNGLRHEPAVGTCGWFIWSGETLSQEADFFVPSHVFHLTDVCPRIIPYIGLAPGWRFQLALPAHEDVWWDASLLAV